MNGVQRVLVVGGTLALGALAACTSDRPRPTAPLLSPPPPRNSVRVGGFTAVSAGHWHTCALEWNGRVVCWGWNDDQQSTPPAGHFTDVSAGFRHTCGVRRDGTVACWGFNGSGEATPLPGRFTAVSAGWGHTCGVRTDGTVGCWGENYFGQATPLPGRFTAVSAGDAHTCGLREDGTVACWGKSNSGQATPLPGTFTAVSAGSEYTCGLRELGTIQCWGQDFYGRAIPPAGTFAVVSAAYLHTCGVGTDGIVVCWGNNKYGQATPPAGTFTDVSAADEHTCGVRADRTIACWGDNSFGQRAVPIFATCEICLGPTGITQSIGTDEVLTATVQDGDVPVAGKTVTFTIVDGPGAGISAERITDDSGNASFTVTSKVAGTLGVRAAFVDASGATQTSDRAAITFIPRPTNRPPLVTGVHQYPSALPLSVSATTCGPSSGRYTACIQFAASDPDPEGPFQAWVEWGDGTRLGPYLVPRNEFSIVAGHDYAAPGTYTVTVTTQDVFGATDARTLTWTVAR